MLGFRISHIVVVGCLAGAVIACNSGGNSQLAATTSGGAGGPGAGGAGAGGSGIGGEPSWIVATGSGGCDTTLYDPPDLSSLHVDECSVIDHLSNPPNSGPHYGTWSAFKTYEEAIPWGFLVHGLEHGGIVLAYNCPGGCDAEVAKMQAFVDDQPQDDECSRAVKARFTIMPDPNLDVPFAVAAWGHMAKGDCFDETVVADFVEAHYAKAPEDVCAQGVDVSSPDARIPEDCGK
jgi:hypothetical protein